MLDVAQGRNERLRAIAELTPRQREVLALIARGMSTAEIARHIFRTVKTVESHRLALGRKFGAKNRVELARLAIEAGLVDLDRAPSRSAVGDDQDVLRAQLTRTPSSCDALRAIDAGTAAVTGEDFFHALMSHLSLSFKAACAFVTELVGDSVMRSVAAWTSDGPLPPFEYALQGSPCEHLSRAEVRLVEGGLERFCSSPTLISEYKVRALMVTPLHDPKGGRLGTFGLMFQTPPTDLVFPQAVMRIFAGRLSAEIGRKRAEEALRVSERRYRLIAEHSADLVCEMNMDGEVEWASPSWRTLLGYEPGDLLGPVPLKLCHPDEVEMVAARLRSLFSGVLRVCFEQRLRHSAGHYLWFEKLAYVVRSQEGQRPMIVCTHRNITESKRAEARLSRLRALLDKAESMTLIGTWEYDMNTQTAHWSRQFYAILGLTPGTVPPSKTAFVERIHPSDRDRLIGQLNSAMTSGASVDCSFRILRPNGSIQPVTAMVEVLQDGCGVPAWMYGTLQEAASDPV